MTVYRKKYYPFTRAIQTPSQTSAFAGLPCITAATLSMDLRPWFGDTYVEMFGYCFHQPPPDRPYEFSRGRRTASRPA